MRRSRIPFFHAGLVLLLQMTMAGQECGFVPLTPAQPPLKVEEGERATESQTFQTAVFALSPSNVPHFFDAAFRIRRIEPNARLTTVVGNGRQAETVTLGTALDTSLPTVSQLLFSPAGVLHFVAVGRVFRVINGAVEITAGSGRPGFNGETGLAQEVNLGAIVHATFLPDGTLILIDGFNRVRRLDSDGVVRTIAGSTRVAAAAGLTGDNGPATEAALSNPRQLVALRDGTFWIKDLGGRHIRLVTQDGTIRTINQNFETAVNIALLPDGTPAGLASNRVYPLRPNGTFETGVNPFSPFTGTPRALASDGSLFFEGSSRPEQRNPLVRMRSAVQTVMGAAPVAATIDGQAPPFGIWYPRTNSLIYSASQGGKSGILEARPGQAPRFIVGGGTDIGEPEGKTATELSIFGIAAFSVDGEGRIVVADVNRRRLLVVGTDGKVSVLKAQGEQVLYAPLGSFSTLQRIVADTAGNIYWYTQGATPTGGIFTAEISAWNRSSGTVTTFTVAGLYQMVRLEDGSAGVIAGNGTNFRNVYRMSPAGLGEIVAPFRMLPFVSITRSEGQPYFVTGGRLFRGEPGKIGALDLTALPTTTNFNPDFVLASSEHVIVHLASNSGFYRIDNINACLWAAQPAIETNGIVNAASGEFTNLIAPRQLITIYGSGLGPVEGQGLVLDGFLRATGQPAPYPALLLGNFSGTLPNATLTGTSLPVVSSNAEKVTVQGVSTIPASGTYLLYYSWRGLQLIHPAPVRAQVAAPGLFTVTGEKNGPAQAKNEDGTAHSEENPAAPGALIHLLGTGFGAIGTNLAMGEFFSLTTRVNLSNPVSVTIGELDASVEFAGGSPGSLSINQISVRVPEELETGIHEVHVSVRGQVTAATQRAWIYVKKLD